MMSDFLRTLMDSVRRFGSLANNEEIIGDNHAPPPACGHCRGIGVGESHRGD